MTEINPWLVASFDAAYKVLLSQVSAAPMVPVGSASAEVYNTGAAGLATSYNTS